jgi:hypothetical protein
MLLTDRLDHNGRFSSYDLDRLKLEFENWEIRASESARQQLSADGWMLMFCALDTFSHLDTGTSPAHTFMQTSAKRGTGGVSLFGRAGRQRRCERPNWFE